MKITSLTFSALAACLLVPALASAAERVPMHVECSAVRPTWTSAREFILLYEGGGKVLKDVIVKEKQRVFTPTDEKSFYTTRGKKGWGVIITVPNQRDGRWTGKQTDAGEEFKLKATDGGASFILGPVEADPKLRTLTWKADMEGPAGEELTSEGGGSCRVISTEVDTPPAPEADNLDAPKPDAAPAPEAEKPQASKPDATPAPKKPRKEIRLFGSRKKDASADEAEK